MEETTLLKLDKVDICREENVILHRASFTLHNGEFVYVIGKVGSGKIFYNGISLCILT